MVWNMADKSNKNVALLTKHSTQQKYLQKQGWTLLSSAVVLYQLQFRLDVINLAFSCYLQFQFFNQHLFWAGQAMNSMPSQILERWQQFGVH